MSEQWLDDLHAGARSVRECRYAVEHLAGVMYAAGNDRIADQLGEIAGELRGAYDAINRGTGNCVTRAVHGAQESTANMMRAVLSVLTTEHPTPEARP